MMIQHSICIAIAVLQKKKKRKKKGGYKLSYKIVLTVKVLTEVSLEGAEEVT